VCEIKFNVNSHTTFSGKTTFYFFMRTESTEEGGFRKTYFFINFKIKNHEFLKNRQFSLKSQFFNPQFMFRCQFLCNFLFLCVFRHFCVQLFISDPFWYDVSKKSVLKNLCRKSKSRQNFKKVSTNRCLTREIFKNCIIVHNFDHFWVWGF
jgi:hypothetical protein